MKRNRSCIFITCSLILLFTLTSCGKNNISKESKRLIEFRNDELIQEFSPAAFQPKDTEVAKIPGTKNNWIVGDFDGDSLGEIIFGYHFTTNPPNNPLMGAMLLKQEEGKWIKKYEFREKATQLYLAKAYDFTGDQKTDLVLGWEINQTYSNKQIYLYQWGKKDLESLGNFICSKLDVTDVDGLYGKDKQYELGIWNESDESVDIDIMRWNPYTTLPLLFPSEYGKLYTESKLSRAEDLEAAYFKNFVIPELLTLEKKFPNESKYDFALIQSYVKAFLFEEAKRKIDTSEGTLFQKDYEKIPFLLAQVNFLQGNIVSGNQILQKELAKKINRVDAGYTFQLLGRTYAKAKEWDKAMLAYNNALIFHRSFPENSGYDSENQFQFSLAKDKARLEVQKHFSELIGNLTDDSYRKYFQNHVTSINKNKNIPLFHCSEFYLSLNEYSEPYGTIITWEQNGKRESLIFMSIDEDQHKFKFNYAPTELINEKARNGWKLTLTFKEKSIDTNNSNYLKKIILWDKNGWKLITSPE